MGGDQSFLMDTRWLNKAVDVMSCDRADTVFMVGAGNGQLASTISEFCSVTLVEPDENIAQYLYSLDLRKTTVIHSLPSILINEEPFDKLVCLQPSLMTTDMVNALLDKKFSVAVAIVHDDVLRSFRSRDRLGTLLRACFDVNILNRVPMTAYTPKLEKTASLISVVPKNDGGPVSASLRLLVSEYGTMRGLLTRSCREFFGYTLADAQEAVRILDQSLLKKRFSELSEGEFKSIVEWLRLG